MKLRNRCWIIILVFIAMIILLQHKLSMKKMIHESEAIFKNENAFILFTDRETDEVVSEAEVDVRTLDLWRKVNANARRSPNYEEEANDDSADDLGNNVVEAIIVPHSHNDPGWLKTVDQYFEDQTRHILDNVLQKLTRYPNMTFVWAETIFLAKWWEWLSDVDKESVRDLIKQGRLEILGGGWVVPDEASTHYTALINNFLEGHLWLVENLRATPKFSWSLDPFGYSSFLPYLYNRIGFEGAVVLRIHTDVKKLLYENKLLEFKWRQTFDKSRSTDMRTLVLPFMLYNIKHQCGPDQQTCLLFDFRNIQGEFSESRAIPVEEENIKELAEKLSEQYRRKAAMQKNKKAVLIPLGDDFRYDRELEWDQQYTNYMKLINYINNNPQLKVRVRFGVVSDFFKALDGGRLADNSTHLPVLSGDFFPYSDRDNDYWTGFYSTRMWLKRLGRILNAKLHSAEVLHLRSIIDSKINKRFNRKRTDKLQQLLTTARRHAALFQHHDAITGTSKDFVAQDYSRKLIQAIRHVDQIIEESIQQIFELNSDQSSPESKPKLRVLSERLNSNIPDLLIIDSHGGTELMVFNSNLHNNTAVMSLSVSSDTDNLTVWKFNSDGSYKDVICQVDMSKNMVLSFVDTMAPHELSIYKILPATKDSTCMTSQLSQTNKTHQTFDINNNHLIATFDTTSGQLLRLTSINGHKNTTLDTFVSFHLYEGLKDGAYIFAPEQSPFEIKLDKKYKVIKGDMFHSVILYVNNLATVTFKIPVVMDSKDPGILVELETNMAGQRYSNLIMRITTDIKSDRNFFTDANGFGTMNRERMPSLKKEANFYPATSYIFIESSTRKGKKTKNKENKPKRLTVLMSDPHGVSSTSSGVIEVMLDRVLPYDDGRGLGSGISGNIPSPTIFRLIPEEFIRNPEEINSTQSIRFRHPSLKSLRALEMLQRPPILVAATPLDIKVKHKFMQAIPRIDAGSIPSDVTLASLRYLNASTSDNDVVSCHLIFHRYAREEHMLADIVQDNEYNTDHDVRFYSSKQSWSRCGFKVGSLFPGVKIETLSSTSLTTGHAEVNVQPLKGLCFNASSLNSFRVVFEKF